MEDWKRGEIRVADGVVAVIAGMAAQEVDGIALKSGGFYQLAHRIAGSQLAKGIEVKIEEKQLTLDMRVGVMYGVKIHQVCRDLQERVKQDVEDLTGLEVLAVNVRVERIEK
ncbi:Asp23/Gls24 family envelope stress response protein [Brevibacillus sp. SYP-B805]|uniref:Asp23/Gls24 family envelope stress response protein n=1 Tax=Brevibacillus sp. SYP-B805 TaxID=1578199 RepID=UPI0013E9CC3E|nr:Asp23/Gls24 family envelope stress response protein [Brevibacillus sp. SYP-B805]NGQ94765.1 Asp23/Gls24 family envelope stress response protein [Brevibacillus sp. SYP-B805]